jgi:hypothetical protein
MADRIEREIEEILRKIDDLPERRKAKAARKTPPSTGPSNLRVLSRVNMRKVMMWSLFAIIVGALLFRAVPGGYFLLIGAIIVFVTAFILSTRGGPTTNAPEKRWRGQPLDLNEPTWPNRFKAWWKGRGRT